MSPICSPFSPVVSGWEAPAVVSAVEKYVARSFVTSTSNPGGKIVRDPILFGCCTTRDPPAYTQSRICSSSVVGNTTSLP